MKTKDEDFHETPLKMRGCVPRLRFPEFDALGKWPCLHGDELFDPIVNKNHNSDLPILAISQEYGAVPREEIDYNVVVTDRSIESYKVVEVGDFIISLRSFQGGIEYSEYKGICSPAYIVLRKKIQSIENQFFRYYFKTDAYINALNKNIEGIRDGKMVSYAQFSEIMLPFPKLKEQKKIAACLSSLDDFIAIHNRKLEALKKYKKGLMQNLFPAEGEKMPRFRFPEFRNNAEWKVLALCEISENLDNKRIPIIENERIRGNTPYYGASGIIDYVDRFIFDEDVLCISEDGANLLARTYPIAFSISGKSWINNHAHVLRFEEKATQIIVENHINYTSLADYLTGMAQPKLNRSKLDIIPIPLPSIPERQKIASALTSVDELLAAQTKEFKALKRYKQGFMHGLLPAIDEDD